MNSGLDIFQAVNYLQGQVMNAFSSYIVDLNRSLRLSTKLASEISTRLALGMLEPVAAQIDPIKLAEMQRATEIAFAYGARLNERSNNLRTGGLSQLVTGYPSHSFVIDRKEARTLFTDVRRPEGVASELCDALLAQMDADTDSNVPKVTMVTVPFLLEGDANANTPSAAGSAGGPEAGQSSVNGVGAPDTAETSPASSATQAANDPPPGSSGPDKGIAAG